MIVDLGDQFLFVAWFNTVLRIHIILIRIRILSTDLLPYLLLIKGTVDVNSLKGRGESPELALQPKSASYFIEKP